MSKAAETNSPSNFIQEMIREDLATGKHQTVRTRFPPEPNGYLHIGHAKSICLNFGLAEQFGGTCNLRFDDTNPLTEDPEFVESIQADVRWLGWDWEDRLFHASDYFERLYGYAEDLILGGNAFVDSSTEEEIRAARGTVTEAGTDSPFRNRAVEENLDLFRRMRAGEFADGEHVLRGKVDMASPNMKMRDPLLYRIRHAHHYRSGDAWCIYPLYDFTHCLSDSIENITHSLCTLEFENNRELYDWVLDHLDVPQPQPRQTEFARLKLNYTVLSKRKLKELVEGNFVDGWDDPRMPTLSGLRRRGYTASAIRSFCDRIGVAKANSTVDVGLLEHSIRDDLNHQAPRVMAVLNPLRIVLENYEVGRVEQLEASYWPHDVPREGTRDVPFGRELYIDRDDFMEDPPANFNRLAPGREVRLRYGYIIRCESVVRDAAGEVAELRCTYDPASRGGTAADGRKIRGTIHWVAAEPSIAAEVRLYDRLFSNEQPDEGKGDADYKSSLNPQSLNVLTTARLEPSLSTAQPGDRFQFERLGYFYLEPETSAPGRPVFNRIVTLRDTWAKLSAAADGESPAEGRRSRKKTTATEPVVVHDPLAGLSEEELANLQRLTTTYG
ncbi:MAG: glutamine--tRNA ligase/YqeY domain fusion protein, partial [Thermoanaerobaculia bacterium]|nr:glutamine--tRNA ligase/YqeY domain fusion protein [Thermoanaerobaculia bacterium]